MVRKLLSAWLLALPLWPARAEAASVALLEAASRSPALTEAVFRLKGELSAVGLEVDVEHRPQADGAEFREALERLSRVRRVDAVVNVVGDEEPVAVEIWTFGADQRLEVARVVADVRSDNPAANLAIRASEVVRSKLVERGLLAREPSPSDSPRTLDHAAPAEPETRSESLGMEVGALLLAGPRGVGPAVMPVVRLDWALSSRVRLMLTAAGFGTRATVTGQLGSAEVAQKYVLAGISGCAWCSRDLSPFASFSLGALSTSVSGHAMSPDRGRDVSRASLLFDAGLGLRQRLSARVFLSFEVHAQLSEPYLAIHFADTVVATSGRPNVTLGLALGVWL